MLFLIKKQKEIKQHTLNNLWMKELVINEIRKYFDIIRKGVLEQVGPYQIGVMAAQEDKAFMLSPSLITRWGLPGMLVI